MHCHDDELERVDLKVLKLKVSIRKCLLVDERLKPILCHDKIIAIAG